MTVIPAWMVVTAFGLVSAIMITAHAVLLRRFHNLDKECSVLSLQIAEHKGKLELSVKTMGDLTRAINALMGRPSNGG